MSWRNVQEGNKKAKRRIKKYWFTRYDPVSGLIFAEDWYLREFRRARKSTKRCSCIMCDKIGISHSAKVQMDKFNIGDWQ